MSYWKQTKINFGTIVEQSKREFVFFSLPDIPEVIRVEGTCGCTSLRYIKEDGQLHVTYKSGGVPYHLNAQKVNKSIIVFYRDGEVETLSIVGTKLKKK